MTQRCITRTAPANLYHYVISSLLYSYYQDTIRESVAIELVTANINTVAALQNFDYLCRFVFSVPGSTPLARTAARSGSVFSCRSPVNSQVPPLPNGKGEMVRVYVCVCGGGGGGGGIN